MRLLGMIFFIGIAAISIVSAEEVKPMIPEKMLEHINWIAQACFKIQADGMAIYFDPYSIQAEDKADLIFITHKHQDHLSAEDLGKIITDRTIVFAPETCKEDIAKLGYKNVTYLKPGAVHQHGSITIETVPAYNVTKTKFHPRENNWLGYILTIDGVRIYHAGDTERIPEMKTFSCDIALLPLGQTYTMNSVEEATQAAQDVKAKIAIPMHFGFYEGKEEDALAFKNLLATDDKIKVVILSPQAKK